MPPGSAMKASGELRHERLALVHRADDAQVVEAGVADLAVEERLGNDPMTSPPAPRAASARAPIIPSFAPP